MKKSILKMIQRQTLKYYKFFIKNSKKIFFSRSIKTNVSKIKKTDFSRFQKFVSSLVIFSLLFSTTFRIPFSSIFTAEAKNRDFYNIVSVIVKQDVYNKIKGEIDIYSSDLQANLENTKVVILPIPNYADAFSISSMNESLYLDGYAGLDKKVNFESRLIGTVLVGDIALPVIADGTNTSKSIAPYTDFVDKAYIYNRETQTYKKNTDSKDSFKPEIWHGVISPNTGDFSKNISELKAYFKKNHDFYTGKGIYQNKNLILNGNKKDVLSSNYKPYVFYFDEFREQNSINYSSYKAYKAYLDNREDLIYNRFSKELANKIKQEVLGAENSELKALASKIDDKELQKAFEKVSGPDLSASSDIATKSVIENTIKKFVSIFNPGYISDLRTSVHNAGRYNSGATDVGVDFVPYFVSVLDLVSDEVLKSTNTDLENQIDTIIKAKLAKDIKIPTGSKQNNGEDTFILWHKEYTNYFAGKKASDITNTWDCSIYRGSTYNSGTLVEANRGLDIKENIISADSEAGRRCNGNPIGLYGGSSPTNIDTSNITLGDFSLKAHDNKKAVLPLFDILGSEKSTDTTKNPSPRDCLTRDFIKTYEDYNEGFLFWQYDVLNQHNNHSYGWNRWNNCTDNELIKNYNKGDISGYKTISSFMAHKSPTSSELSAEINNPITQNLPIDKDRYVDFFAGENGTSYKKILYPNLFDIKASSKIDIEKELSNILTKKNKELGNNIDLLGYLKNKPYKQVEIDGEKKQVSYFDFLVFSILWKNMTNTSAKYKFVLENYLNDQIGGNDFDFVLAKNKKQYEIAYLAVPGDAANMYVKIEPEDKATNPYADLLAKNANLDSHILSAKIITNKKQKDRQKLFNCAPPEGVSLLEWLPAVMCRLKDMLPPKISIGENGCGESLFATGKQTEKDSCEAGDLNKNGVSDCLEAKLEGASLSLSSTSPKYFYNSSSNLFIELRDKDNNPIITDNSSYVETKLEKIVDKETGETIFDSQKDNFKENLAKISHYLAFSQNTLRLQAGKTKTYFSVKSKDADIYFKSAIKKLDNSKKEVLSVSSNTLKISVRGEHLFISPTSIASGEQTSSFVTVASDKANIYLYDDTKKTLKDIENIDSSPKLAFAISNLSKTGEKRPLEFPLDIKLEDANGNNLQHKTVSSLENITSLFVLSKSGKYKLIISDNYGFNTSANFEILASKPASIDLKLGANVMEADSVISTNVVSIYDEFANPVVGENYNLKLKIYGDAVSFVQDDKKELETTIFEGFQAFRLKSNSTGVSRIEASLYDGDKAILTKSENQKVISKIKLDISLDKNLQVGYKTSTFTITAKDELGNTLTDLNSRIYLVVDEKYGELDKPYTDFKSGVAKFSFTTDIKAGKLIPFSFLLQGSNKTTISKININPEKALKINLSSSNQKLEANIESKTTIEASLIDIYGNTVFTDNTTKLDFEVPILYKNILHSVGNKTKVVSDGKVTFDVQATQNPGTAYVLVSANPSLANNISQLTIDGKQVDISGVNKNAIKIQTYFFYNKKSLEISKYNALYTTLIGADYGDITKKDYLASAILFSPKSRALTVSSIISNPYNTKNIFEIQKSGAVKKMDLGADLSQDIDISIKTDNSRTYLDLYDKINKTNIGNVFFNFSSETNLEICKDINCIKDTKNSSIFTFSSSPNYDISVKDEKIVIKDLKGELLFSVSKTGNIFSRGGFSLKPNYNQTSKAFIFDVIDSNSQLVTSVGFYFYAAEIKKSSGKTVLDSLLRDKNANNIILYTNNNSYVVENLNGKANISYKDPFSDEYDVNFFAKDNLYAYENIVSQDGLGWKDGNKSLLLFASGESVGEATRNYASLGLVNLGDPVVSLKPIKKKLPTTSKIRSFDATIGKKLNDEGISNYKVFDYNADSRDDILLFTKDKFFALLEAKPIAGDFLNQRNLAYVSDIGNSELIQTGDFTGDNYEDIFFVANYGVGYLLNNNQKDFTRIKLSANHKISKSQVFDMDADGKDDIIILDDSGNIIIYYGGGTSLKPSFTKQTVYSGSGITLSQAPRDDNTSIYFDSMSDFKSNNSSSEIDESLLDNLIFEKLPYSKTEANSDDTQIEIEQKTFIRSQYAETVGLKLEKTFKDVNGGDLKTGDKVQVKAVLKNISAKTIKNIAYLENIDDIFELQIDSISNSKNTKVKAGIGIYDFLIDDFSLSVGESIEINYEMKTRPISFGYLQAGLFEKDEAGDDKYGDIILKASEANCSNTVDIIRSISSRKYLKGKQSPSCDVNKMKLPSELTKDYKTDKNKDNIPDLFEEAKGGIKNFAEDIKNIFSLDFDRDGNPDKTDNSPRYTNDGSLGDKLDSLNSQVDDISQGVDNFIEGFGCGFGGGACISSPLNRAPLAPGNDPVFMGKLIGDGLKVDEGIPFFSALTGINVPTSRGCYQIPAVWPASPFKFTGVCNTTNGAGGSLGTNSATNFVRLFYTPTITGANGFAACFGAPASVAGNSIPKGLAPVVPGGNCIVAAYPMDFCSETNKQAGDPRSVGNVFYIGGKGGFGIINANCEKISQGKIFPNTNKLDIPFVKSYLNYKTSGVANSNLTNNYNTSVANYNAGTNMGLPLVSYDGGNSGIGESNVSLDLSSAASGDYTDVVKVENKATTAFPSFIMDWVTEQLQEIITKLTDLPTLFVILPDFSALYNGDWGKYITGENGLTEAYKKGEELQAKKDARIDEQIQILEQKLKNETDIGKQALLKAKIWDLEAEKGLGLKKQYSGIQQVYEFLGNVPIVNITTQDVAVNIPWIDRASLEKTIISRKLTVNSRNAELDRAKKAWSYGLSNCETESCKDEYSLQEKAILDTQATISSLQKNISILEEYRRIPEQLASLVNKKQDRLNQITCNVDVISEMTGGWLGDNGERFKKWVEFYILIKAILHSWQLLADIFIEYDDECHECKNERHDSVGGQFELVSFIIPKIPIIKFPKWPDIILDLHSIRVNLDITIPEFDFSTRPISLPLLPELNLPDSPSGSLSLPKLPLLPTFELPELPDLPGLPTVELPDLPPPPKLPKLFSQIEGFLNILKLVTKAMCIMKKSPFVPEWRAGDQIAFLTERSGYKGFDFINLTSPQFSYPFVDAIKVSTFVNLEFDAEFLVEMAETIAEPLNTFSSDYNFDYRNAINEGKDVDLGDKVIPDIDIDIKDDGTIKTSMKADDFASMMTSFVSKISRVLDTDYKKELSSTDMIISLNKNLAIKSIVSNPKFDNLRAKVKELSNYDFAKEDMIIKNLKQNSKDKFDTVKSIIETEKQKNKDILKQIQSNKKVKQVSDTNISNIDAYKEALKPYNKSFVKSLQNLTKKDEQTQKLESEARTIETKFNSVLKPNQNYFAANISPEKTSKTNSCQAANKAETRYNYEGIYVVENDISYNLFDYKNELNGHEKTTDIDLGADSKNDLLYLMGGDLYLKKNLLSKNDDVYASTNPITVDIEDNKFVNKDIFYEAVNNFSETVVSNNSINLSFSDSNNPLVNNYRIEYNTIVDKYLNEKNDSFIPTKTNKSIIDAFSDNQYLGAIDTKDESYRKSKNLAYISYVGNNVANTKIYTKKLEVINNSLIDDKIVSILSGTKIYSAKAGASIYYLDSEKQEKEVVLGKNENISFDEKIDIYKISGGELYINTNQDIVLSGQSQINNYLNKPLFLGSKIESTRGAKTDPRAYLEVSYYDNSKLRLDLNEVVNYEIYDLGDRSESYFVSKKVKNDYFYARIYTFRDDINSTKSQQILLSPQREADKSAPELNFANKIRIPVYQEKIVDFSENIYENAGLDNISKIVISGIDLDKYEFLSSPGKVRVKFKVFDTIFTKNIKVSLYDTNYNFTTKDVELEIYSPTPQINDFTDNKLAGTLDEELTNEPVNIYRIRGGIIKKLKDSQNRTKVMTSTGSFDFSVSSPNGELALEVNKKEIATITEKSGKIKLLDNSYTIVVDDENLDYYPDINIVSKDAKKVFYENIKSNQFDEISIVDSFKDINNIGLYLNISNKTDYGFYTLSQTLNYNPGAVVIYSNNDSTKTPIAVIFKDGRIKLSSDYSLSYDEVGENIVLNIKSKTGDIISRVLYNINNTYLIR